MSAWTADRAKIVSVATLTVLGLLTWMCSQLWSTFMERGETLLQLERRQGLIELKSDNEHMLLRECRDDVKEVRSDVKEILRRVGGGRVPDAH